MDFNEANNILKRIKREYKAFMDLEDLIQFCSGLVQKRSGLEKEISDLAGLKAEGKKAVAEMEGHLSALLVSGKKAEADHLAKVKVLEDDYAGRMGRLHTEYESESLRLIKDLQSIKARISGASKSFEDIQGAIREGQSRLDGIRAQYEEFKRSLK